MAGEEPIERAQPDWRERLSDEQYHVLREGGTERPFSGRYVHNHRHGLYHCAGCGAELFASDAKFESGSGWPSFTAPVAAERISEHADRSQGLRRVEIRCAGCAGHLGHVFPDGPGPTGLRYCINSSALDFRGSDEA